DNVPPTLYTLSLHDALPISKWDEIARSLNLRVDTRYRDPRRLKPGKGLRVVARASNASPPTCSGTVNAGVTSRAELNGIPVANRSEEHTSELQSLRHLVCRL